MKNPFSFLYRDCKLALQSLLLCLSLNATMIAFAQEATEEKKPESPSHEKTTQGQKTTQEDFFRKHWVGLGLGQTFPMGKFKRNGQDELTFDFFYAYAASYSFDFVINYHQATLDRGSQHVKTQGLAFDIKARLFDFDSFAPYVIGGLGFYRPRLRRQVGNDFIESQARIVLGANAGAGIDLKLNERFHFGFLSIVHVPFKVKQETQPSVRGYYLKLMMTGMFSF